MSELVHVTASNEELAIAAFDLSEQQKQPYYTDARKEQIGLELRRIFFELRERNIALLDGQGGQDERISA